MFRRGEGEGRPDLHSFPSTDQGFARTVRLVVADNPPASPADLETILRRQFPNVVVLRRVLSGEPRTVWYVFRDGKVRPA